MCCWCSGEKNKVLCQREKQQRKWCISEYVCKRWDPFLLSSRMRHSDSHTTLAALRASVIICHMRQETIAVHPSFCCCPQPTDDVTSCPLACSSSQRHATARCLCPSPSFHLETDGHITTHSRRLTKQVNGILAQVRDLDFSKRGFITWILVRGRILCWR